MHYNEGLGEQQNDRLTTVTQARTSRTWSIMWCNVGMLPLPVCWSAPAMPLPISNGLVGYRVLILYVIIHAE